MLTIIFPGAVITGVLMPVVLEWLVMSWDVVLLSAVCICVPKEFVQEMADRDIWGVKRIDDECCSVTQIVSSF